MKYVVQENEKSIKGLIKVDEKEVISKSLLDKPLETGYIRPQPIGRGPAFFHLPFRTFGAWRAGTPMR